MKKIRVYYTMINVSRTEEAETVIDLPIMNGLEDLAKGEKCGIAKKLLTEALKNIAILQGYHFKEIETIEEI